MSVWVCACAGRGGGGFGGLVFCESGGGGGEVGRCWINCGGGGGFVYGGLGGVAVEDAGLVVGGG